MKFNIISLFPEFFPSLMQTGLMGKAIKDGLAAFSFLNPRDFSEDRHRHVDDKPFGGGPGMVMSIQPLHDALAALPRPGRILLMSPSGKKFDQSLARELSGEESLTLICGRYEGIDDRLRSFFPMEEISLCDAVLNGGEVAAWAIIEAICRYIPGFMGKGESSEEESYSDNLLEYPQYTRPEIFDNIPVPEILLGGHHGRIAEWRRRQSLLKTLRVRPDLLNDAPLSENDASFLAKASIRKAGRAISFCLCHYPVFLDQKRSGASSLTNLDIHDIARISFTYGMGPFYALTPLEDQLELLRGILRHWLRPGAPKENSNRSQALKLVRPVQSYGEVEKDATQYYGEKPVWVVTSARWPRKRMPLAPRDILELSAKKPVIICLGTARGLDADNMGIEFASMRPIRFASENHLSVRAAAAILADRILGDFH